MADFEQGIAMELATQWSRNRQRAIGFLGKAGEDPRSAGADGPIKEAAKNGAGETKTQL